jgi:hypothetical protein
MKIARVVEKGNPSDSHPPLTDALPSVMGSASKGKGHGGSQGSLDEETASNDEDEPDDYPRMAVYLLLPGPTLKTATFPLFSLWQYSG